MTKYHLVHAVGLDGKPYGHAIGHIDQHDEGAMPWVAYLYQVGEPGEGAIVIEKKRRVVHVGSFHDKELAARAIRMAQIYGPPN